MYSLSDFMAGKPGKLFQAVASPKIFITWPHGDEELGPRFGHYLYTRRSDLFRHVDYLCGNPRAAAKDVRFIDSDLNRCFTLKPKGNNYEQTRAQEILKIIEKGKYDYVIQLHTSVSDAARFIIIEELNPAVKKIVAASHMDRVVVLTQSIADTGILSTVNNAVEIEFNEEEAREPKAMKELEDLIDNLVNDLKNVKPKPREFYYIRHPILRADDPGEGIENFKLCEHGYYPVLVGKGPRSYREDRSKPYVGFAAEKSSDIHL